MIRLEQRLFLLLVALLPFFRPFFVRVRGVGPIVIAADFVFVLTVLAWLVSLARGHATIRWSRFYIFGGLYLAALALSVPFSAEPTTSLIKLPGEMYLVGIAVLAINLVRDWDDLKPVLTMWAAATAVVALAGVTGTLLFYAGWRSLDVNFALERFGSLPPGNYPRLRATFENANAMCTYMGVGLMILPLMHALGWIRTAWYGAISTAAWITAILSLSPGLGGLLLARGWWEWKRHGEDPGRRLLARAALAAGIAGAAFFFAAVLIEPSPRSGSAAPIVMGRPLEPSPRVLLWGRAIESIAARPIVGKGVGTNLEPMLYVSAAGERQRLADPHNVWLSVGVQSGLVGLAAFIALVVYVWRCSRRLDDDDEPRTLTKLAFRGAFASILFYQGLSGSFENSRHLWLLIGLIVSIGDEA